MTVLISVNDLFLLSMYAFSCLFYYRHLSYPHVLSVINNVRLVHIHICIHICVWVGGYVCACVWSSEKNLRCS